MAPTAMPLRPQLAAPRQSPAASALLDEVIRSTASRGFDPDAYHVMDERDTSLIEQEILHGSGSTKFVYDFKILDTRVTGISVVGARHLAAHYGGLKHRLVASTQKVGALFIFRSYPSKDTPMHVSCSPIPELEHEEDFFEALVEITDIKTGNAVQTERRETRYGVSGRGTRYEKPHYATIAQSKAYRNGVLSLIPQDVQLRWKAEMLKLGNKDEITEGVLDQKRAAVIQFAAGKGLPIERRAVEDLMLEQIAGLAEAAREGALPAFTQAARALGLLAPEDIGEVGEAEQPKTPPAERPRQQRGQRAQPQQPEAARAAPSPQQDDDVPAHIRDTPPIGGPEPVDTGPQRMVPRQVNFEV